MNLDAGKDLADEATIIFHVSGGRTRPRDRGHNPCDSIDADGLVCHEDGISVTWVEYFEQQSNPMAAAAIQMRGELTFRSTGVIASANVGELRRSMTQILPEFRIVYDPQPHNKGHALIIGVADHDMGSKAALADLVKTFISNKDVPGLIV